MFATLDLIDHVNDHPWPGCVVELWGMKVTLMSSSIATMILVAVASSCVLIPLARRRTRRGGVPRGAENVVEALVVFVRDMIARPALHEKTYEHLPFLLTLFVFILGNNLFGIVPLESVSQALGLPHFGAPATAVLAVCAALAAIALGRILWVGLVKRARHLRHERHWPLGLCLAAAPLSWFLSLSPPIAGITGRLMLVPLAFLEFIGVLAKCFALMVRLTANMLSGHTLLAVLMMFILQALTGFLEQQTPHVFYVAPVCILGSVVVSLLELLVAGLQAYIFTFLTAMFLGLYAEGAH
jgi:F-type H+-transporting ATPase subunit a